MPATAIALDPVRDPLAPTGVVDQVADVVGEFLELVGLGRVRGQMALGMADRPGLQRGVEVDLAPAADDQLGRAAADVEDEDRLVAGALRGRPQVGQVGLLLAGQKPGVEVEALPQLGDEGLAVDGVAHGAGSDRHHPLGPQLLVARLVVGDHAADVVHRVRAEVARVLDPAPEVGDGGPALDLADLGPLDVSDQQARRVRPDVDDGDPHRGHASLRLPLTARHSSAAAPAGRPTTDGSKTSGWPPKPICMPDPYPRTPTQTAAPALKSMHRRGVEQSGSSSGS